MTKRNLPRADIAARPGMRSTVSDQVLQRWVPELQAAVDDSSVPTISILDVIGDDFWGEGVTAKRISAALRAIGPQDVVVYINSPGGDFFEGLAIYNVLRDHPGLITVKILGLAASAASVIAMAGDRIEIGRAGFLMIHNTWIVTLGDRHKLREMADWLDPFDGASVDLYAARTGIEPNEIVQLLDRETWIRGSHAVDEGWADAFLPADEVDQARNNDTKASLRAERRFDMVAARAGMKRSEGRELMAALKGGKLDAASSGMRDAAVIQGVEALLLELKAL